MTLKNIIGFAVGPLASAGLGLILVPVVAWSFAPSDVARMNVFQIAVSFSLLFTLLGLDQAYVREYHESNNKGRLLRSCFLPGFMLLGAVVAISLPFSSDLAFLLYERADPVLYFLTVFAFFASYLSRFLALTLRMQGRGWAYSVSQVTPKVLQLILVLVITIAFSARDFLQLQSTMLLSMVAVVFFCVWSTRDEWKKALKKDTQSSELKKLLAFGFPLMFSSLAYWGLTAASTLALRAWSSLEELAVYSVAGSFAGAAIVFQSIFTVIWAPTVYRWVSEGADMSVVDRVAKQAMAIIFAIVAICGSLSWFCDWLLPSRYSDVKYILICMLMQPLLYTLSEITCVGIGIERRTIHSVWITLLAMLINIVLGYFLVPSHGAAGAAASNAIAFSAFFFARTEVSSRIWRSIPRGNLYFCVTLLVSLAVGMSFWATFFQSLAHISWVFLFFFSLYFYRDQWVELVALLYKSRP